MNVLPARIKGAVRRRLVRFLKRHEIGQRLILLLKSVPVSPPAAVDDAKLQELSRSVERVNALAENMAKVTMDLEERLEEISSAVARLEAERAAPESPD